MCPYLVWLSKDTRKHSAAIVFDRSVLLLSSNRKLSFSSRSGNYLIAEVEAAMHAFNDRITIEKRVDFPFWLSRRYSLTTSKLVLLWSFAAFNEISSAVPSVSIAKLDATAIWKAECMCAVEYNGCELSYSEAGSRCHFVQIVIYYDSVSHGNLSYRVCKQNQSNMKL